MCFNYNILRKKRAHYCFFGLTLFFLAEPMILDVYKKYMCSRVFELFTYNARVLVVGYRRRKITIQFFMLETSPPPYFFHKRVSS